MVGGAPGTGRRAVLETEAAEVQQFREPPPTKLHVALQPENPQAASLKNTERNSGKAGTRRQQGFGDGKGGLRLSACSLSGGTWIL